MNSQSTFFAPMATPFVEQLRHASLRLLPPVEARLDFDTPHWVALYAFAPGLIEIHPAGGGWCRMALPCRAAVVVEPATSVRLLDELPCEWLVVGMQPEYLVELSSRELSFSAPLLAQSTAPLSDDGLTAVCKEMRRLILSGYLCEAGYLGALVDAMTARLSALLHQAPAAPQALAHLSPAKLRLALRLIEEHIAEVCTIEGLADAVGLSRAHFSRAFKQATGAAPSQYILLRKVIKARELLRDLTLPLSQVAQMAGFSSQSHLSSVFKAQFGATPGRYRRALAGGD